MSELVSIIIPVYNVLDFLVDCIESVRKQTYENTEIIIVDDGSNDGSEVICDNYKKIDDRIKVIHQKNAGLSNARNVGVQEALGEYVLFVDSDDVIHSQMLEVLYDTLLVNNAEMAFCSYKKVEENYTNTKEKEIIEIKEYQIYSGREVLKRMYEEAYSIDVVVAWNKLYKREYLLKEPYPLGKKHEDEFTTYKIFFPLKKCVHVPEQLYFYRQREGSIINQKFDLRSLDKVLALEERKNFFYKENDEELYLMTLRRYETALAEAILNVQKFDSKKKEVLTNLKEKFILCWKNEIKKSRIDFKDKMKYLLFMLNKELYKWLKDYYER